MEYSAFLQLDDVRGESRTAPCVGWIPLASVQGMVPRQSENRDVVVVAPHGVHTTYLFKAASDGKSFRKGEIAFVRNGSKYLAYKMEDVLIAGFQVGGASEGVPMEMVTLAPKELKVSHG